MKKLLFLAGAIMMASFFACTGEAGRLKSRNDSIENVNSQQREILFELTSTLVDVSTSLDSIAAAEGLLKRDMGEGGKALTKQQVIDNLNAFKAMLAENRAKLDEMQKQLSARDGQIGKLNAVVKHLNKEIAEKEATIKRLYDIIAQKDATIADLQGEVDKLSGTIAEMHDESEQQQKLIDQQDNSINEVFYVVGKSSELKKSGLLTSRFLGKKKVNLENLDRSLFMKADRRTLTEIAIPAKSAKVRTNMPEDSYTIRKNEDKTSTLVITDPASFWNYTHFLIIEI